MFQKLHFFYIFVVFLAIILVFFIIYKIFSLKYPYNNRSFSEQPLILSLYGDSLMSGYKVAPNEFLSFHFSQRLTNKGIQNIVHNKSIPGDTSSEALERIELVIKDNPDIVILCIGANDMIQGVDPNKINENIESIILALEEQNIIVILAGMLASRLLNKNYNTHFDDIFPDIAKKHNLIFMPFLLKDVAFKPDYLLSDLVHPNSKGISKIADNLWEYLEKAINQL